MRDRIAEIKAECAQLRKQMIYDCSTLEETRPLMNKYKALQEEMLLLLKGQCLSEIRAYNRENFIRMRQKAAEMCANAALYMRE